MAEGQKVKQTARIMNHLVRNGSITQSEAFELYGISRLGARIWDLRNSGHKIQKLMETGKNRYGDQVCYARYYLVSGDRT